MSKLIGTNPNQVPSNADLGSAAFMDAKDFLTARGSSLSAIDAVIPKTAVDVFIYDTSKDSDGGSWRKRCQHLSWYNEKLNTTTRGSRKEFPAVAVIVATTSSVTIYDGDDPTLPMWMVFSYQSGAGWIAYINVTYLGTAISSISAINGVIGIGVNNSNYGGFLFGNFLADNGGIIYYGFNELKFDGYISDRNSIYSGRFISSRRIINRGVNDVAMTVLHNAPIDSATGLPVPTIAVGTNGGVSVITDDGRVFSGHTGVEVQNISIHKSGALIYSVPGAGNDNYSYHVDALNTSRDTFYDNRTTEGAYDTFINESNRDCIFEGAKNKVTFGQSAGLMRVVENLTDFSTGLHNRTTSTYNTGWMSGDIKLATLSDTSAADVTGTELVTNGTFDSDTTGWSEGGTFAGTDGNFTVESGRLKLVSTTNNDWTYYVAQEITNFVIGKTYILSVETENQSAYYSQIALGDVTVTGTPNDRAVTIMTAKWVATSTTADVLLRGYFTETGDTVYYDNISVRLAEEDRSVFDNGLQVFGTVKKTPVAAGADLVAYSGFSASIYLQQPYNNTFPIDSSQDFVYSVWFKTTQSVNSACIILALSDFQLGKARYLYTNNGALRLDTYGGGWTPSVPVNDGVWHHAVAIYRQNGIGDLYVDGKLVGSDDFSYAPVTMDGNAPLWIGSMASIGGTTPFDGSIALARISATAPSPEQIKKMYEDEKVLFQENAKSTLYGTSNAVTALAYDDSTELLHVGTSAGRSVFQGLRRGDNTTDAVGTAISAVNGMVVEE